jgi:hypothetical protein
MTTRVTVLLALAAAALCPSAMALEVDSLHHTPTGRLLIQATVDSAVVLIDGERLGVTPFAIDSLPEGQHRVTVLHPDLESWFTGSITETVVVRSDTTMVIRYDPKSRYFISSEPDGAGVYAGDSLLGTTPIVLQGVGSEELRSLRLRKEGYADGNPVSMSDSPFLLNASLQPEWLPERLHDHALLKFDSGPSTTPLYIAGAATVISGTAAAYLKIRADKRYEQYLSTNDPAILSQTQSLDTAAAVALVATQVSVALLAYFLLNE